MTVLYESLGSGAQHLRALATAQQRDDAAACRGLHELEASIARYDTRALLRVLDTEVACCRDDTAPDPQI